MDAPAWIALTAILAGLIAAGVAWNATRYAAKLQAAQKAQDVKMTSLEKASDAISDALAELLVYSFKVPGKERRMEAGPEGDRDRILTLKTPPLSAIQRAEFATGALIWEDLRTQCENVLEQMKTAVKPPNVDGVDPYDEFVGQKPNPAVAVATALRERRRLLIQEYPVNLKKNAN